MQKLLICDVDGTLTGTISGNDFKQHPKDVKVLEGVLEGLETHYNQGWHICAVSNQGGIPRYKSLEAAIQEFQYTMELIPYLQSVYFCPDFAGQQCYHLDRHGRVVAVHETWLKYRYLIGYFRKPNPGMIRLAIQHEFWVPSAWVPSKNTSKARLLMIGDRTEDKQSALNAGIDFQDASEWRSQFLQIPFA